MFDLIISKLSSDGGDFPSIIEIALSHLRPFLASLGPKSDVPAIVTDYRYLSQVGKVVFCLGDFLCCFIIPASIRRGNLRDYNKVRSGVPYQWDNYMMIKGHTQSLSGPGYVNIIGSLGTQHMVGSPITQFPFDLLLCLDINFQGCWRLLKLCQKDFSVNMFWKFLVSRENRLINIVRNVIRLLFTSLCWIFYTFCHKNNSKIVIIYAEL